MGLGWGLLRMEKRVRGFWGGGCGSGLSREGRSRRRAWLGVED